MELFDKMTNILGKNIETELINAISTVKEKLNSLDEDRMCKVYSSFLLEELLKRHIPSRLINTSDLGLDYEHVFVLIKKDDTETYFLVDLTFSQFDSYSVYFSKLLIDGYQNIDDKGLNCYLSLVAKEKFIDEFSLDSIFFSKQSSNTGKII